MGTTLILQTQNLHLDNGEIIPAQVVCTPGQPLEIREGRLPNANLTLPENVHIALARVDPHVHFRESYFPSPTEFEKDKFHSKKVTYKALIDHIDKTNKNYNAVMGSLAALKGGVWLIGAMGNTPWPPLGQQRWEKTCRHYQQRASIYTHVWPRIEPGVPMIKEQDEKDFGSTFGGTGISAEQRRQMYLARKSGVVSYHNDKPRDNESLKTFRDKKNPPDYLLHHLYYDGETVLAAQRETFELAEEANLAGLHTRHIPTGPGLDMVIQARENSNVEHIAEVGLDYLYFNRDMLAERDTRLINYRRPSLPSAEDQAALIQLTRERAQLRDPLTFIGSDHAPHTPDAKAFRPNGLPGSPGTRILEHTHQVHMHLMQNHRFSYADIDWLSAIAPAHYIARYKSFPYPIGTMQNGAMANLVVFDPTKPYHVNETRLSHVLQDPHYHTAYRDEELVGQVIFTVVNGLVYDVKDEIKALNRHTLSSY